ncbi:MAG: phage tail tube protein, partial [Desulfarculus sp.]|nr:phage tail tube protein [Desulfarculus sp.]
RRLKGRVYVRAGGQVLAMAADQEVTVKKGGVKRDPVAMNDGEVYFTEQPVTASVECTVKLLAGMTMEEFQDMDNVTVTVETDDGWSGVLANAFCAGDLQMGKGGDVKVCFYGATLEETNGAS